MFIVYCYSHINTGTLRRHSITNSTKSKEIIDEKAKTHFEMNIQRVCAVIAVFSLCLMTCDAQDCITGPSSQYSGAHSVTTSGIPCQRWDVNTPHKVTQIPTDGGHHNHCRNPDNDSRGTWCYTTADTTRWDYCKIPKCDDNARLIWSTYYEAHGESAFTAINADPEYLQQMSTGGLQKDTSYNVTFDESELKALDVTPGGDIIFSDIGNNFVGVYRQESGLTSTYLEGEAETIHAITQDPVSGNVYYTDPHRKVVMASDNDFRAQVQVYKTAFGAPQGIVVLPAKRKLVYSVTFRTGSQVMVANLDGSAVTVLLSVGKNITALTADEQRIYWIDNLGYASKVMSSRFDGGNVVEHYSESQVEFQDIAVHSSHIYLTDAKARYNIFGDVRYRIKIVGKTDNSKFTMLKYGKPCGIAVLDASKEIPEADESLKKCQTACSGICLERFPGQVTCVCPAGFSFDPFTKACVEVQGTLLSVEEDLKS